MSAIYRVESDTGYPLGDYVGDDRVDAVVNMLVDAGIDRAAIEVDPYSNLIYTDYSPAHGVYYVGNIAQSEIEVLPI